MNTHEFSMDFPCIFHGFPMDFPIGTRGFSLKSPATKVAVAKVAKLQETAARRLANERIGLMIFVMKNNDNQS